MAPNKGATPFEVEWTKENSVTCCQICTSDEIEPAVGFRISYCIFILPCLYIRWVVYGELVRQDCLETIQQVVLLVWQLEFEFFNRKMNTKWKKRLLQCKYWGWQEYMGREGLTIQQKKNLWIISTPSMRPNHQFHIYSWFHVVLVRAGGWNLWFILTTVLWFCCRSKLICKLTGDTINKSEEHIWKHISGKRFQHKLGLSSIPFFTFFPFGLKKSYSIPYIICSWLSISCFWYYWMLS